MARPRTDFGDNAWVRARHDIERVRHSVWFWLLEICGSAAGTLATFGFVEDSTHSITVRALVAGLGGVVSALSVFTLIFVGLALRAPYRQRDEARSELALFIGPPSFRLKVLPGFLGGLGHVLPIEVLNDGLDNDFEAEIIEVQPRDPANPPPWSAKWRDDSRSKRTRISRGSSAVLLPLIGRAGKSDDGTLYVSVVFLKPDNEDGKEQMIWWEEGFVRRSRVVARLSVRSLHPMRIHEQAIAILAVESPNGVTVEFKDFDPH
jgi:hypothetical protein